MGTLTLRLPDDLKEQLDILSRQQGRPTSELVKESIRQYLAVEQLKSLRQMSKALAEAQGFLTDDDILQEVS